MRDLCPHCGVQLPTFRDAFCPECFRPLDELPPDPSPIQVDASLPSIGPSDIAGAEILTWDQLADEIKRGSRLVIFHYCVSIGILTFLKSSKVHLVREGESALAKGWKYTLLSSVVGWWGFPFGFILTPVAIARNLGGGRDVTAMLAGRIIGGT